MIVLVERSSADHATKSASLANFSLDVGRDGGPGIPSTGPIYRLYVQAALLTGDQRLVSAAWRYHYEIDRLAVVDFEIVHLRERSAHLCDRLPVRDSR